MKKPDQKYFTVAVYAFAVLAFSILFLMLCVNFGLITSAVGSFFSAIGAILYAILFALLLLPAVRRLEKGYERIFCRKTPHPNLVSGLAITTAILLTFVAILVLLVGIVPHLMGDAEQLYSAVTGAQSSLESFVTSHSENFPFLGNLYDAFKAILKSGSTDTTLTPIFSPFNALGTAASQLSNIFLGLIIAVYFLASRRMISGIMGKIMVALFPRRRAVGIVHFFKRLYTDFSAFASIRLLSAFLLSLLTLLLCLALQIPLLSILVIVALVSHLIPVIGPILGDTAAIIFVFILKPWYVAVIFALLLLSFEILAASIILPRMLPKKLHPPYALTALAVLVGFFFFGIIGAFVAVPLYATLNIEVRRFLLHRLHKKGLPTTAEAYRSFSAETYANLYKEEPTDETAEESEKSGSPDV